VLAFRGAGGEPPRRLSACGVSPVPLLPQESSTFRSNQLLFSGFLSKKPIKKQHCAKNQHWALTQPKNKEFIHSKHFIP
jgi:hypothetical protein